MFRMEKITTYKSPFCLVWEITDTCNLKCSHCRASAKKSSEFIPNPKLEERIIDEIIKNDILVVNISGGEPLLHPDCVSFVKKLSDEGVHVGLSTNGILFPKYAKALKEANLGFVQISLDGSEQVHNKFRNSNSAFKKAVEALRLAKKMGFRVQLNCVENIYNIDDLQFIYNFANEEDIEMHVRRFVPSGYGKDNEDLIPKEDAHFKTLKILNDMQKNSKVRVSIEAPLIHFLSKESLNNHIGCGAGITQLGIDQNGNMYPCIFNRILVGNIMKEDLESIWNYSDILLKIRNREFEKCKDCSAKIYCGGCQACAENPFEADPLCPLEENYTNIDHIENKKQNIIERYIQV